jgi:D-sedoheptulose 7-phosphate isomerase
MAFTTCNGATEYLQAMQAQLARLDPSAIDRYVDLIFQAWQDDRLVLVFGNGGSAYTASHHVTDYVKTAAVDGRRRLRAISLVDNIGLTTALGNDISYDDTLCYPLESYARPGDVAVGISCSGNSPNVVKACQWAKDHGMSVVAITGFSGGRIGSIADVHIHVSSDNYGVVEDIQMMIGHIVAQSLQARVQALEVVA